VLLVSSRYPLVSATTLRSGSKSHHVQVAHLLPKLRCHYAEFLNQSSLKRLGILYPSTWVGLRYGHLANFLRGFSREHGINHFAEPEGTTRHHVSALKEQRICLPLPPTRLNQDIQHPADLPFSVTPSVKRWLGGSGILTGFPSPTPFGLDLGTD
jgi:hypothetical protein